MITITDLMTSKERQDYLAFVHKHTNCPFCSTIGGKLSVEVTGTGLGYVFVCKCNSCGAEEDITDTEKW